MDTNSLKHRSGFLEGINFTAENTRLALLMLRHLMSKKDPSQVFEYFSKNSDVIFGIIFPRKEDEKAYGAIQHVAGALLWGGSLMYCVGMATLFMVPVLGYAIGGLGAYSAYYGYKALSTEKKKMEFLGSFYACMMLMRQADQCITEAEKHQMEVFFSSFGFSAEEIAKLLKIQVKTLDDVIVPGWLEKDHKRAILAGCWSLVACDGVTTQEEAAFHPLGAKLGFAKAEIEEIKKELATQLDEGERFLVVLGTISGGFLPELDEQGKKAFVKILSCLNAKAEAKTVMNQAIKWNLSPEEIDKALEGKREWCKSALAGAFVLGKALTLLKDSPIFIQGDKYQAIARKLGLETESREYQRMVDGLFKAFENPPARK